MPVFERNITYFFPTSPQSRQDAIEANKLHGRQWVSTSIQQGHERMKFCTFESIPDPHKPQYYKSAPVYPKKLVPYQGKEK